MSYDYSQDENPIPKLEAFPLYHTQVTRVQIHIQEESEGSILKC